MILHMHIIRYIARACIPLWHRNILITSKLAIVWFDLFCLKEKNNYEFHSKEDTKGMINPWNSKNKHCVPSSCTVQIKPYKIGSGSDAVVEIGSYEFKTPLADK